MLHCSSSASIRIQAMFLRELGGSPLDRIKTTILTALVIAIICVPTASAQATATTLTVISGNGQMPCPTCAGKAFRTFYPLVVRVTDNNGFDVVPERRYYKRPCWCNCRR